MGQEKSECAWPNCKEEAIGSSKDGYCVFHAKAEEKDVRKFNEALKNYIERIKTEGLNFNFAGFIFVDDVNFRRDFGVTFFEKANFGGAQFQRDADFSKIQFEWATSFSEAKFRGITLFRETEFQNSVHFREAQFQGTTDFWKAQFQGTTDFWRAQFYEGAFFWKTYFGGKTAVLRTRFQGRTSFREAEFKEETSFEQTQFQGTIDFWRAQFYVTADFSETQFRGITSFRETQFRGVTRFEAAQFHRSAFISPEFIKGIISFEDANLENISLTPLNLDKNALIDFKNARLRNTQIKRKDIEDHIIQEQGKDFSAAKEIYLLLKNNFHTIGRYDGESWAFTKEKEMERRSFWHFRKEYKERELGEKWRNKGIKDCFYPALFNFEYTAKYIQDHYFPTREKIKKLFAYVANFAQHPISNIRGELKNLVSFMAKNKEKKMGNVSRKELSKALWFYIKYPIKYFWSTILKYLYGWGEWPWLIFGWCAVTIFTFSGFYYLWGVIATKDGTLVKSYLAKLYFSGVTFTALGYGDYSPVGRARILAVFESFLGIFLIALFVFSFARRTGGR